MTVVTVTSDHTVTTSTITYSTRPHTSDSVPATTTSTKSTSSTTHSEPTSTTDSLGAPGRPTMSTTTTDTHSTTGGSDMCPTGFYACSAVYHGGCCQTGRNCDTTSCPTTRSTTFTSNGETIVVPVATGNSNSRSGRCAHGWFHCADTAGGGCCPQGYACGASCTATGAATTVAKEQATGGSNSLNVGSIGKAKGPVGVLWMIVMYIWNS